MKKLLLIALFLFALAPLVTATNHNSITLNAQDTQAFFNEIPSIHTQLQANPVTIPSGANFLIANGNTVFDINMNAGGKESFYLTVNGGQLNGIFKGSASCTQFVSISEDNFDKILQNKNQIGPVVSDLFLKGQLGISGCGVISKMRIFFAKLFGKSFMKKQAANLNANPTIPVGTATGKPDYCDDTYLPGHREYAENKELWDSYSANTDKVCQSQYGRGAPDGTCIHMIQLSINGNPYYLCWYNE